MTRDEEVVNFAVHGDNMDPRDMIAYLPPKVAEIPGLFRSSPFKPRALSAVVISP